MNKYEFIPLVLMKSDKAGVLEYSQLIYSQGPEGTNTSYWPCLTSSGPPPTLPTAQEPIPAPWGSQSLPWRCSNSAGLQLPHPCLAIPGQCLTLGTPTGPDLDLQVDLPARPWTCPSQQTCLMTWVLG